MAPFSKIQRTHFQAINFLYKAGISLFILEFGKEENNSDFSIEHLIGILNSVLIHYERSVKQTRRWGSRKTRLIVSFQEVSTSKSQFLLNNQKTRAQETTAKQINKLASRKTSNHSFATPSILSPPPQTPLKSKSISFLSPYKLLPFFTLFLTILFPVSEGKRRFKAYFLLFYSYFFHSPFS